MGILLGSIFNFPNYLGLTLLFGLLGILVPHPRGLAILAVLFSLFLYILVALWVTRRTGDSRQGIWAALLAALIAVLVASVTASLIAFSPLLTGSADLPALNYLIGFKELCLSTMALIFAQAMHALIGGCVGSFLARLWAVPSSADA